MATFKLNKTAKGKKFEYTVTNENGEIVSSRISARDYVACTADGIYYFGRLDLIGKGEHGRMIAYYRFFSNKQDLNEDSKIKFAKHLEALNSIAYL